MRVRIIRKLADWVDGIDLSRSTVGDFTDMPERHARIMVAERWAVFARRAADGEASADSAEPLSPSTAEGRRIGAERRRFSRLNDLYQRLRDKCDQIEQERRRLRRRATDAGELPP